MEICDIKSYGGLSWRGGRLQPHHKHEESLLRHVSQRAMTHHSSDRVGQLVMVEHNLKKPGRDASYHSLTFGVITQHAQTIDKTKIWLARAALDNKEVELPAQVRVAAAEPMRGARFRRKVAWCQRTGFAPLVSGR